MTRSIAFLTGLLLLAGGFLFIAYHQTPGRPSLVTLFDPVDGLYRTARQAKYPARVQVILDVLDDPVQIYRDHRGVPHIFASSDRDATIALGYIMAQDRLFQMDFITRVTAGKLSEIFGPTTLETDRALRRTGMDWGAQQNLQRILKENGIEQQTIEAFLQGANAWIRSLKPADYPLEFRLLGYTPRLLSPLDIVRLIQYMSFDLTYRTDDVAYSRLREHLGPQDFELLFPRHARLNVPIIPTSSPSKLPASLSMASPSTEALQLLEAHQKALQHIPYYSGNRPDIGSNNWAVHRKKSDTGAPLLAGDMHLRLTLPSIWYEVQLVTPSTNIYGVTLPGAPLIIEGFNQHISWAFTNSGADVIDFYALKLDSSRTRYWYLDRWCDLDMRLDTLYIAGKEPVIDTLWFAHWGPLLKRGTESIAIQWTAHQPNRTLHALWLMNRATSVDSFQQALRYWDTPAQNILVADAQGNIAIRTTGYIPIRGKGYEAKGVLDGTNDTFAWTGRIPFDDLPYAYNPDQQYLASANQEPVDSTYAYYLNRDWLDSYRALRINELLQKKPKHTKEDFQQYQADVYAMHHRLFVPLLKDLDGLSPFADSLRLLLLNWDGWTRTSQIEPLIMDEFRLALRRLTWDEPIFQETRQPRETQLWYLLTRHPHSRWLDIEATTPDRESARDLLLMAMEATAYKIAQDPGKDPEDWVWGKHHQIVFKHLTQSEALKSLWRGPYPYPGFYQTLSPADSRLTTHSASWRMIVDFSTSPPTGYGVFPGGESGNPASSFYDNFISTYLTFSLYPLYRPLRASAFEPDSMSSRIELYP